MRRLAVLAALLAVMAGCQGAFGSVEPADVETTGGELTVDPGLVFARVQATLDTDVPAPERVRVPEPELRDRNASDNGTGGNETVATARLPPFREAVGLRADPVENDSLASGIAGLTSPLGPVVTYPGRNGTPDDERLVVAHEFVHYVQFQNDRSAQLRRQVSDTTDGRFVVRSLLEGVAVYTTDRYMARYTDNGTRNSPLYDRIRVALPEGHVGQYGNDQYVEGREYVASRVTSPARVAEVYESPPVTSEQVIHNLTAAAEPPREVVVSATVPEGYRQVGTDRLGEAFVRTTLSVGVPRERAARAAAGWGTDRLRVYRPADGDAAYVWTFAWDSPAEEAEFERTLRAYLDARGERRDGRWRVEEGLTAAVEPAGPETTVLVLGPERFVGETAVAAAAR